MQFYKRLRTEKNGPFVRSGHMVRNKLHWDASYTVGLEKNKNQAAAAKSFNQSIFVQFREVSNLTKSATSFPMTALRGHM